MRNHGHSLACLNPCFNGRCTRTTLELLKKGKEVTVLILVLMEDALAQIYMMNLNIKLRVLILVLMEDALALFHRELLRSTSRSVLILVLMEDALAPDAWHTVETRKLVS